MKHASSVCAFVLLFSLGARAQDSAIPPSEPVVALANTAASAAAEAPRAFASVTLAPTEGLGESPAGTSSASSNSAVPQFGVINVEQSYSFQAYAGYTFVRVYAFPAREVNRNGVDVSVSYFFRKGLLGVEGAVTGAFGSIGGESSDFAFYGGGPRVRVGGPRGLEFWAHGLVGDAHFGPRISGYTQDGLTYEVGGGVDIKAKWRRFAYRLEGDMIGSRLYSTTQYSPKISAGIVYKF
jgi:hypothetical protein